MDAPDANLDHGKVLTSMLVDLHVFKLLCGVGGFPPLPSYQVFLYLGTQCSLTL